MPLWLMVQIISSGNFDFTSTKWNIPDIVNYDGLPSYNSSHSPKPPPEPKPSHKLKPSPEPKPQLPMNNISNKNKYCNLKPADIGVCECANPNDPNDKLPCTLQSDGVCKISGNDGWEYAILNVVNKYIYSF